jgi:hypothetical protein
LSNLGWITVRKDCQGSRSSMATPNNAEGSFL